MKMTKTITETRKIYDSVGRLIEELTRTEVTEEVVAKNATTEPTQVTRSGIGIK